jgi:hypothetical protein
VNWEKTTKTTTPLCSETSIRAGLETEQDANSSGFGDSRDNSCSSKPATWQKGRGRDTRMRIAERERERERVALGVGFW